MELKLYKHYQHGRLVLLLIAPLMELKHHIFTT